MTDWDDLLATLGLTPSTPSALSTPIPDSCTCAGTRTAYQQHRKRGETPCAPSRAANAAYQRRTTGARQRTRPACGTYSGYQAHLRRGEEACGRCAEARRERDRAAYAARRTKAA